MVAMTKLEKFMFDTEFEIDDPDWDKDETEEPVDPDTLPRYSEHEMRAALEAAREEGRAAGHASGLAEARDEIAAFAANELVTIGKQIERIAAAEERNTDGARREAAELALAIGRRLSGALIDAHPVEFAEQMIVETLGHLTEALRESKIVIRVTPALVDPLTEHIATVTAKVAFTGQAIVIGDDALQTGDCRVEWAHGGAELLQEQSERWVRDAVDRYITAITPSEEPEAPIEEAPADQPAEEAPAQETPGVIATGGSKSVRYDDAAEADSGAKEEDDGVIETGGSKSVRYDDPADQEPAGDSGEETPDAEANPDDGIKTVGGSKSVRYD